MSTTSKVTACDNCGEPVEQPATGRPRKFCSDACKKQAAAWTEKAKEDAAWDDPITKAEHALVAVLNNDILRAKLWEVMYRYAKAVGSAIRSFEAMEKMVPVEMKGTTALVVLDDDGGVAHSFKSVNEWLATAAVAELVCERFGHGVTSTKVTKRVKARLIDGQRSSEEFERRWVLERDEETGAILTDAAGNDIMKRITVRRSWPADLRDRENDIDDSSDDPMGDDGLNSRERRVVRNAPSSPRGSVFSNPAEQAVNNVERQRRLEKLRGTDAVAWRIYAVYKASQTDARTFAEEGEAIITSRDSVSFGMGVNTIHPVPPMTESEAEASFQPKDPNQDIWAILDYWFPDVSEEEREQRLRKAIKYVER